MVSQMFFEGFDLCAGIKDKTAARSARDQAKVASLLYAYRDQGHRIARVNPLVQAEPEHPQLALEQFELSPADLERTFDTGHLSGAQRATLGEIITLLRETYCGAIGVEYLHIQDRRRRRWLQSQMESTRNNPTFSREKKLEILRLLIDAELF